MRLIVHPAAASLGVVQPVAYRLHGLDPTADGSVLDAEVEALRTELETGADELLARPEVRGFRQLFAASGHEGVTPAGEKLVRLIDRRGMRRYGPVIDAYNIASARHASGLGLHDPGEIADDVVVHVDRARGDEWIVPLFESERRQVARGDLIYGLGDEAGGATTLLAWLGRHDVDSDDHKVTDDSSSLLLVALGNGATPEAYNRSACEEAVRLLRLASPDVEAEPLVAERSDRSDEPNERRGDRT